MRAELFPIAECPTGRLAIMPRPRAGDWLEDEVLSWRHHGMNTVVSLLEDSEIEELGLAEEATVCGNAGLSFLRFPIPDRGVPASEHLLSRLVTDIVLDLQSGRSMGIHCRIGVGRSSLLAICVLAVAGLPLESAWKAVAHVRGMRVPDTPEQRSWVGNWFSKRRAGRIEE